MPKRQRTAQGTRRMKETHITEDPSDGADSAIRSVSHQIHQLPAPQGAVSIGLLPTAFTTTFNPFLIIKKSLLKTLKSYWGKKAQKFIVLLVFANHHHLSPALCPTVLFPHCPPRLFVNYSKRPVTFRVTLTTPLSSSRAHQEITLKEIQEPCL